MKTPLRPLTLVCAAALSLTSDLRAEIPIGPGLPHLSFKPEEVGSVLAYFKAPDVYAHGIAAMVNGYLMVPTFNAKGDGAGLEFYDLSDPRKPKLVHRRMDAQTGLIREALSLGSMDGRYYVFQGTDGIIIWDFADVTNPVVTAHLPLPDVRGSRDYVGIRWVSWQAPYLYCAGTDQGLYIVDTTDLARPKLIKHFPISELGGFPIGSAIAVGNVLLLSSTAQSDINALGTGGRFTTLDISDPRNPYVVRTFNSVNSYASQVNGYKILAPGVNGESSILDFPDAEHISLLGTINAGGQGGYAAFQDGYAFIGHHKKVAKITTTDGPPRIAWTATSPIENKDDNFAIPLGNLLFAGQDRGAESAIMVHAADADSTPPSVNMVAPRDGATNLRPTTSVGLTFTDEIDARTLGPKTFFIRAQGSTAPLDGWWSYETGIAHFTPRVPLQTRTTYEIVVPAGGARDWSGNATAATFTSRFTTGEPAPNAAPSIRFIAPGDGARLTSENARIELESLDADGSIARVALLIDGRETATPAPGHAKLALPPLAPGEHILIARATDNLGATTDSHPIRIQIVATDSTKPGALLIVGKPPLADADAALKAHLEKLGFDVALGFGPEITTASTQGHAVVVLSESVESACGVGIALRDVKTPVVVCEPGCYGDMWLTANEATRYYGEAADQSRLVIEKPEHALAAHLTGELAALAKPGKMNFGRPISSALKIARLADPAGAEPRWTIFAYEKGAKLFRSKAPARRVAWYGSIPYILDATPEGWSLFDAAIQWATAPAPNEPPAKTTLM